MGSVLVWSRRVAIIAAMAITLVTELAVGPVEAQGTPAATPAPQPKLPATVKDVNGKEVTVKDVSRIVPLSGDIAEIVYDLGLGANIVAVDVSATYPPQVMGPKPKIGFERALSAEAILAQNPTVVIGKEQAGPPAVLDQVRAAGVPVVIVAEPQTMAAPTAKIRAVAAALGLSAAGEALAAQTRAQIDQATALAQRASSHPKVLFLYVRGPGTQLIAGAGTVADAMVTAAGGIDVGAGAGIQGYQPITAEAVVAAQPDAILAPQSGADSVGGIDGLVKLPGVAQTPAGQAKRVLVFDDLELLGMTPRTGRMLLQLVLALHPELATATPMASPAA